MNYYFLALFILALIYKSLGIHTFLSLIKFAKFIRSSSAPDNKATCETLRGSILKINYNDGNNDLHLETLRPASECPRCARGPVPQGA